MYQLFVKLNFFRMEKQKKVIGIIGGLSPMSTVVYYSQIIECYKRRVETALQYPRLVLSSVNMAEIDSNKKKHDPAKILKVFENAAHDLSSADFIVVASNSLHIVADKFAKRIDKEFLDIRDVVGNELVKKGFSKVLLLGTTYTMQKEFYSGRLLKYGVETVVPDARNQELLNNLVYDELCQGNVYSKADDLITRIINESIEKEQVQAVVYACTEFSLLSRRMLLPVIDSTELHVQAIVDKALNG